MDAPTVRYTTTADGVSIAWGEVGQGTPLLFCPSTPFTHVQEMFAIFEAFHSLLTPAFRLIMFDARGTGMSERDVADVSNATQLADARAVIDAAGLDQFVVFGDMGVMSSSVAIQLAIEFPRRVTHLVLESPVQNMRELADTPWGRTHIALAEADWTVYVQTVFRVLGGWDIADSAWVDPMARAAARWVDPALGLAYERLRDATDVGEILADVRQPTLVLRNDPNAVPAGCCQRIAAKIPGAQFRQYADPTFGQQAELIQRFVGVSPTPSALDKPAGAATRGTARDEPRGAQSHGTAIILFADIVDSTALTERLGDAAFRAKARQLDDALRAAVREHGGAAIDGKLLGDGILATFPAASEAIAAALTLEGAAQAVGLGLHVGLHAGDVIREKDNVYGGAVNIASRISPLSAPNEVLVSATIRELARTSAGVTFEDRGEHALKGIADPVRLYAVRRAGSKARVTGRGTTSNR